MTISSVEELLSLKRFRSLRVLVRSLVDLQSETNYSSEVQARYIASVESYEEAEVFENKFIHIGWNRRFWGRLSSKQRRFLYQIYILVNKSNFYREEFERFLLTNFYQDSFLTNIVRMNLSSEGLLAQLSQLSDKEVQVLNSISKDIRKSLSLKNVSLEDLFHLEVNFSDKPEPLRKERHKGYRDHGTLGVDSIGLSDRQKKQYIRDEDDQFLFEEQGFLQENLVEWYQNPLFYQNVWHIFNGEE